MTVIALFIVALPLLVSVVICGVARREGLPVPARSLAWLVAATLAASAVSLWASRLLVAAALFAVLFVAFAIPVMHALERSAKANLSHDGVRTALLVPRRVRMYLQPWARAARLVTVLAALAWVAARIATTPFPQTMSLSLAFSALAFFGLYEAWMREEVFAVRAKDEDDRRRRVRAVFAAQTGLTLSFLVLAALSAGPGRRMVAIAVAATIIGGTGCAFALSTGIQERYLQAWTPRR